MICQFCGENNRDKAAFCSHCGSPLRENLRRVFRSTDPAPILERPSSFKNGRDPSRKEGKNSGKWLLWGIIVVACVFVITSGIKALPLIFHKGNTAPTATVSVPITQVSHHVTATVLSTQHPLSGSGTNLNVVYVFNQGTSSSPGSAILKRYDIKNGEKTDIVVMANTYMHDAQVSADGKSVIFVADSTGPSKLQMINIDGRGLKTLASITAGITNVLWSPDQRMVVFDETQGDNQVVYLLQITNGSLQAEMEPSPDHLNFRPRAWVGNDIIAMQASGAFGNGPLNSIYLLDITNGGNQKENDLQQLNNGQSGTTTTDFVGSSDGTKLFFSTAVIAFGEGVGIQDGPGSINIQSIPSSSTSPLFRSPTLAIVAIQVIDQHSILMLVQNYDSRGGSYSNNNGIWRINTDGTNLTHLSSISTSASALFDGLIYDTQLHVSPQGAYALDMSSNQTQTLSYGSTVGGGLNAFASTSVGSLQIAGWTNAFS